MLNASSSSSTTTTTTTTGGAGSKEDVVFPATTLDYNPYAGGDKTAYAVHFPVGAEYASVLLTAARDGLYDEGIETVRLGITKLSANARAVGMYVQPGALIGRK